MCCLGFLGLALGAPIEALRNIPYPHHEAVREYYPDWVIEQEPTICFSYAVRRLITINDGTYLSPKEREEALVVEFKRHGVEVEFVGEYPEIPRWFKYGKKEA